jgi:hypothetical protein
MVPQFIFVGETSDGARRWVLHGRTYDYKFLPLATSANAPCPAEDALAVLPQYLVGHII